MENNIPEEDRIELLKKRLTELNKIHFELDMKTQKIGYEINSIHNELKEKLSFKEYWNVIAEIENINN
jgi:NADH/NAD ratio-sensing transcriptional regulator Rex